MLGAGESEALEVVSKAVTPKRVLAISIKDFFPNSPQHTSRGT